MLNKNARNANGKKSKMDVHYSSTRINDYPCTQSLITTPSIALNLKNAPLLHRLYEFRELMATDH